MQHITSAPTVDPEVSLLAEQIKETAQRVYLSQYKVLGKHPGSIKLEGKSGKTCQFIVTDRYPAMDEDVFKLVSDKIGADNVEKSETYAFNPVVLNKHFDLIAAALDKLKIPEDEKENMLTLKTTYSIKKGTIEKANDLPIKLDELFDIVRPISQLKDA